MALAYDGAITAGDLRSAKWASCCPRMSEFGSPQIAPSLGNPQALAEGRRETAISSWPPLRRAPAAIGFHGNSRRSRAYYGMANGQVVLVTTEGLGGGPPLRTVFYVAEPDPAKAEAIIAKIMAPNERVEAYGPLSEAAVKRLGLKPGEFTNA